AHINSAEGALGVVSELLQQALFARLPLRSASAPQREPAEPGEHIALESHQNQPSRQHAKGQRGRGAKKAAHGVTKELETKATENGKTTQHFEWIQRQGGDDGCKQDEQPEAEQVHCVEEEEPTQRQTQIPSANIGFLEPEFQRPPEHVTANGEEKSVEDHIESG